MSKLDVTTQELFLRLGTTSRTRSAKADAVFRRLRMEDASHLTEKLMRAPKKVEASQLSPDASANNNAPAHKTHKR
jgi:plasmid maintenance system killer protein